MEGRVPHNASSLVILGIPSQGVAAMGIEEWLRRSQSMPLSFRWNPRHVDYPTDVTEQILSLLTAQSTRWHQVMMHDSGDIVKKLLAPLESGLPLLEALKIFVSDMVDTYFLNTTAAPRLEHLDITGEFWFNISATPSMQQFILREPIWTASEPSSSLWSPYKVFGLLPTCHKLELVDIILHDMTVVPSDYQVELPSLRELTLRLSYESVIADVGSLLDNLTLPSLQALSIDLHDQGVEVPFLAIQSLIYRSHASLTSFSLDGGLRGDGRLMSDDELIDSILHSPDFNSPVLQRIPGAGALLKTLATPSHSSDSDLCLMLCPVFEQLTFRSATFSESSVSTLTLSRQNDPSYVIHFFSCKLSPANGAKLQLFGERELAQ